MRAILCLTALEPDVGCALRTIGFVKPWHGARGVPYKLSAELAVWSVSVISSAARNLLSNRTRVDRFGARQVAVPQHADITYQQPPFRAHMDGFVVHFQ